MIKKIIIIVVAEIILFTLYIFLFEKPNPSVAIGEIFFAPLVAIINLIAGLLLLALHKKQTAYALFVNIILSPIFFHIVWYGWYEYYGYVNYKTVNFHTVEKKYILTIYKQADDYDIEDRIGGGGTTVASGQYTVRNSTYYLLDSGRTITVTSDKIIGFPEVTDTLQIDTDSYYYR